MMLDIPVPQEFQGKVNIIKKKIQETHESWIHIQNENMERQRAMEEAEMVSKQTNKQNITVFLFLVV